MVVDDDQEVRKFLRRILEREGYEVLTVTSTLHAIEALRELPEIACVIADQKMKGPSGLDLLDYVARKVPRCGRVLFTGYLSGDLAETIAGRHSSVEKVAPWELLVATVAYEIEHRRRVATPFPVR